jgi:hypothetical protein
MNVEPWQLQLLFAVGAIVAVALVVNLIIRLLHREHH